jgi:superoxide dismutase
MGTALAKLIKKDFMEIGKFSYVLQDMLNSTSSSCWALLINIQGEAYKKLHCL